MSSETLLAGAYSVALLLCAGALEWLSAHTHRRSLRYRTAGFDYQADEDVWVCPEGEHLWPHEFDHERRLVRYRARAHVCNRCPLKEHCTDSDQGREIVRPLDPWPHSEAGRFHRAIAVMLVALAGLVAAAALARNHNPAEAGLLVGLLATCALITRLLLRDLRAHPANFPQPSPSQGLRTRGP
jgi:Transposase DDE domain